MEDANAYKDGNTKIATPKFAREIVHSMAVV